MKTLFITATAFLLLCTAMFFNYRHINKTADELCTLTSSLDFDNKEDCKATLLQIKEKWERSKNIFSLSVSFREIDYLGETLISLTHYFEMGDESEFLKYREFLIDAIEGVSRLESFSVINIL